MSNVLKMFPKGKLGSSAQTISYLGREFAVFVVECPYDNYSIPEVREFLPTLFELKIRGYQKEHPYGILPVDAYDQVANHIVFAERVGESWVPRMGFKSVTLDRCNVHHLPFPLYGYLKGTSSEEHRAAIDALVEEHKGREHELGYNGSWTMDPEIRVDRDCRNLIKDVTRALLVHYYRDYQIPTTTAFAVMRFKVHEDKKFIGWDFMKHAGQALPPYLCEVFFNEQVVFMEWRKFSDAALAIAEKYQNLWENRVTLGRSKLGVPVRKIAA